MTLTMRHVYGSQTESPLNTLIDEFNQTTGRDIQSLLNISRNTLKYRNRSICDKLGVSSRKELLKYAALMKKDAENGET